jgi:glycosyltransferase involved in cell wall biosynthesis
LNHVALVIPGLDRIGGAERQTILLAKGLCRHGWQVSVVVLTGTGGDAAAELTAAGVAFTSLNMRKGLTDPRGWARFHRWLKQEKPGVVHAHLPHAAWMVRWSRLAAPMRVVVDTLHSSSTGTFGRRLGYRFSGWLADEVTAVSHAVAAAHLAAKIAPNITVIPNGVDVNQWQPYAAMRGAVRRELMIGDEFLWIAAGRLDAVKDYPATLAAMSQLPCNTQLVIAGSGPLEEQLRRLSRELGLESRVHFLGFEVNVKRWMQAADGFVLTSRWEGLPVALLEAASCALPAVATDVPGTREAIAHGESGWLVPLGDTSALAECMARLMNASRNDRRAMGERARLRVIESFSLESTLNRWEALYADLLQRNRSPHRCAQKL